ncbi:MAG: hypothetical protein HUJ67_07175 [Ruminiclostridium sp.]|nr:hypothetical protein [Ruminiclostridium sp.]
MTNTTHRNTTNYSTPDFNSRTNATAQQAQESSPTQEQDTYKAYPHEMIDVFQAEKISGSLDLLEKISAFEPIYDQAAAAADEIRGLAKRLIPQLDKNIARIAADVESLQTQEDKLTIQIEALDRRIETHTANIDAIFEEKCSNAKGSENVYRSNIENDYSSNHPEYAKLVRERSEKSGERRKVCNEKSDRQSFLSRLEQCKEDIESNKTE